ncbi:MAG: glyoxalase [Candidatus Marinimicrobia bacterium]|nr:glyoxalase [Candidatus Neomarinimicrobiota bacterium]
MTILYVSDQEASKMFYQAVLQTKPSLDVPGMTEFRMGKGLVLGLMPISGIKRLLGDEVIQGYESTNPQVELYFVVDDARGYLSRAIQSGAKPLVDVVVQDWGDRVGYCLDPDNHVLAFAEAPKSLKRSEG